VAARIEQQLAVVLSNLRPSTQTISLRLPKHLLDRIRAQANAKGVAYQSLIKIWLSRMTADDK
jgi:predicted DNA binding CopG/RHH family protein